MCSTGPLAPSTSAFSYVSRSQPNSRIFLLVLRFSSLIKIDSLWFTLTWCFAPSSCIIGLASGCKRHHLNSSSGTLSKCSPQDIGMPLARHFSRLSFICPNYHFRKCNATVLQRRNLEKRKLHRLLLACFFQTRRWGEYQLLWQSLKSRQ